VAYYQQVGRAGRDGHDAVGVLMSGSEDEAIQSNFRVMAFPYPWDIELLLNALCSVEGKSGLSEEQIEQRCNLRPRDIIQVLKTRGSYHHVTADRHRLLGHHSIVGDCVQSVVRRIFRYVRRGKLFQSLKVTEGHRH